MFLFYLEFLYLSLTLSAIFPFFCDNTSSLPTSPMKMIERRRRQRSLLQLLRPLLLLGSAFAFVAPPPSPMTSLAASSDALLLASTHPPRRRRPLLRPHGARTTSEELIPRDVLFGNPENVSPKLSPDGAYLSYLAPSPDGVMNVWVRDLAGGGGGGCGDRMITNEPKRAIRSATWAYDSTTILYMNDDDGDENFHLFAVDAVAPGDQGGGGDPLTVRDLTPGKNVKAQNVITNRRYPDQILVGTNERDPKVFDMYRVFYKTGEKFLDTINPGDVIGWKTEDESFEIRAAVRAVSVGGGGFAVFFYRPRWPCPVRRPQYCPHHATIGL